MNRYIKTPLRIVRKEGSAGIVRSITDVMAMYDNLVELVVFTPRGSFGGDPDFGFEYWNHEYTNINFRDFNNGQKMSFNEVTRQVCEESVRQSILAYGPDLKQIGVSLELRALNDSEQRARRTFSRYEVVVNVSGVLNNGLGTTEDYHKCVKFLMEPVAKTRII